MSVGLLVKCFVTLGVDNCDVNYFTYLILSLCNHPARSILVLLFLRLRAGGTTDLGNSELLLHRPEFRPQKRIEERVVLFIKSEPSIHLQLQLIRPLLHIILLRLIDEELRTVSVLIEGEGRLFAAATPLSGLQVVLEIIDQLVAKERCGQVDHELIVTWK